MAYLVRDARSRSPIGAEFILSEMRPRGPIPGLEAPEAVATAVDRIRVSLSMKLRSNPPVLPENDRNPIAAVGPIRTRSAKKGVFSPEQIRCLFEVAEGDWKGLILSPYFTGGRLVDLARLTWGDIDFSEKTITFVQGKTGSSVQIPIHQDLYEYLLELPRSDRPKKPVFPKLFDKPGAGKSGLSMAFKRVMERAGIDDGVARKKDGKLGRNVSRLSFHSLRHSFNSAITNSHICETKLTLTIIHLISFEVDSKARANILLPYFITIDFGCSDGTC